MTNPELLKLISKDELKALTGCAYKQPQIDWLKANDMPHVVDAIGRAQVYKAHAMMLGYDLVGPKMSGGN